MTLPRLAWRGKAFISFNNTLKFDQPLLRSHLSLGRDLEMRQQAAWYMLKRIRITAPARDLKKSEGSLMKEFLSAFFDKWDSKSWLRRAAKSYHPSIFH